MANWKKIIVSGSNPELNNITGSKLRLTNLPKDANNQNPLVIDADGNISTGSAYALASGGSTVGGNGLSGNIAIIGNQGSLIQTASSTQKVDFNTAKLDNISQLTASKAIFNTIALSGSSPEGSGSSANLFNISFTNTESAALTIPSTNLHGIDFKIPITMSNVPQGTVSDTNVLVLNSSGHVVTRSNSDLGGVTQVQGGTNINVNSSVGSVTVNLDDNILLNDITSSGNLFFTASSPNNQYVIDYAKVIKQGTGIPELSSGSLQITASGIKVEGNLEATGSVTLGGALSFNGFNFIETSINNVSGSTIFGSASAANIATTTHQFTGSVLITGSKLILSGGVLGIPGFSDVSASLAALAAPPAGFVTNTTFNAFSSSYSQSVVDFIDTSGSIATEIGNFQSFSSSFSQSVTDLNTQVGIFQSFSSSFSQSVVDFLTTSASLATQITNFSSFSASFSSSIDNLTSFSESIIAAIKVTGTDTEFQNNVTIKGNLDVQGTTTTINTQDLSVEDRFILLGSGSAGMDDNLDVGIIFDSGSQDGSGMALFYDNSEDRLSVGRNVHNVSHSVAEDGTETAFNIGESQKGEVAGQVVTVKTAQTSPPSGSASSSFGEGEMYIDNNNDIYIYVE